MQALTILMKSLAVTLAVLCISYRAVHANPPAVQAGIAEFAKCSRQCVAENEQCRKQHADKCGKSDSNCFEPCDIAYPACMAKCPRPGGG